MIEKKKRPVTLSGITYKRQTSLGKLYLTVNWHEGQIFEVFGNLGKAGSDQRASTEEVCRLISLLLRIDCPIELIIGQLEGIQGRNPIWDDGKLVKGIGDAIAKMLKQAMEEDFGEESGVPAEPVEPRPVEEVDIPQVDIPTVPVDENDVPSEPGSKEFIVPKFGGPDRPDFPTGVPYTPPLPDGPQYVLFRTSLKFKRTHITDENVHRGHYGLCGVIRHFISDMPVEFTAAEDDQLCANCAEIAALCLGMEKSDLEIAA